MAIFKSQYRKDIEWIEAYEKKRHQTLDEICGLRFSHHEKTGNEHETTRTAIDRAEEKFALQTEVQGLRQAALMRRLERGLSVVYLAIAVMILVILYRHCFR
jgi:hypothetical protein